MKMTALEEEIRKRGPAGTLPDDLRVENYKWELQAGTKKRRRDEGSNAASQPAPVFRGTAETAEYIGTGNGLI